MRLLDRCIDRPLPIFLIAASLIFLGLWSVSDLPVKRAPKIEIPYSLVVIPYVGAAPMDVESEVTIELEEELNGLDSLRHGISISKEGVSTHFLEFEDRTDMGEALRRVRDKVDLARAEFPEDVDFPIVEEISFDDVPVIFFTLTGGVDRYRLRELAENIRPELEAVAGVSRVDIFGGFEREVKIVADPAVLAIYGLTLAELSQIIERQSHSVPAGQLRGNNTQRLVRATGELKSIREIESLTVAMEPTGPVALRDVAEVVLSHRRLTSGAWYNGDDSVSSIVRRKPEVNTLETIRLLKERVAELESTLPPGVQIAVTSDSSTEINRMLRQLGMSAAVGILLVIFVLLLIFGLRRALLVASVLPFSLLFTFIGLRLFGMEISNVAIFGLILVLGLVVDGAIIVGEAIFAEREAGASPVAAAKIGIARVGLPVIAADLTTIAAFCPMLLMEGIMGQFMAVIPKVVVFALIGSIFVDHFLLPAASAKLEPSNEAAKPPRLAPDGLPWVSPELPRIRRSYRRSLDWALGQAWTIVGGAVVVLMACVGVALSGAIDTIFLPTVDQGRFTVSYALPLGTRLEETNRVGALVMRDIADIPEVDSFVLTTGDTGAMNSDARQGGKQGPEYGKIAVDLVSKSERVRGQGEVVAEVRRKIAKYAGVDIDVKELGEGPPVGAAVAVRIKGDDMDDLAAAADRVRDSISALHGAEDVRVDYERSNPQLQIEIDRPRAESQFGVTPNQVSHAMLTAFQGVEVGRMWIGGERVDLRLGAPDAYGDDIENVRELPLRSRSGDLVPLGEVANVQLSFSENAIYRHDWERTVTVRADVAAGVSSVALEADARALLATLALPPGISLTYGGESEERNRSNTSLLSALKWGLLAIYVIIAIQFNSLKQPLIVIFTIPLAIIGVVWGLLITGHPFSFVVFIGVVSLTGIVVNDGIVMVDGINQKRDAGMPLRDAILNAATRRLRPVILTTVTTIAGLLPLTLDIADGGEFWVPLGITIISGLIVASTLTLFIVPIFYSMIEGMDRLERVRLTPQDSLGTTDNARQIRVAGEMREADS